MCLVSWETLNKWLRVQCVVLRSIRFLACRPDRYQSLRAVRFFPHFTHRFFRCFPALLPGVLMLLAMPLGAATLENVTRHVVQGDYQAALRLLDKLPASQSAEAGFLHATALVGIQQFDEAARLYEQLIDEHPDLAEAYNNLAALRVLQGRLDEARVLLERGMRTDERYARIYENLGKVYVEMARSSYATALRLDTGTQLPQLALLNSLHSAEPAVAGLESLVTPPAAVNEMLATGSGSEEPAPAEDVEALASEAGDVALPVEGGAVLPMGEHAGESEVVEERVGKDTAESGSEPADDKELNAETQVFPEQEAAAEALQEEEILAMLNAWAADWSEQDVTAYLAHYDSRFSPEGTSREAWEKDRRTRIRRPAWIRVELSDIQIRSQGPGVVVVELNQSYRSPSYRDTTLKHLDLLLQDGNWKIVSETNIRVVR